MAGHYYLEDGTPFHSIIGKNGKQRNTTIRDVREHNAFPSVMTVLDILAKPSLDKWKLNQVAMACYNNPSIQNGNYVAPPDAYCADIITKAFNKTKKAADAGSAIHDALEKHYSDKDYDPRKMVYLPDLDKEEPVGTFVLLVDEWMGENGIYPEKMEFPVVSDLGYAGLCDCRATKNTKPGILDFKTRKTSKKDKKLKPYDGHPTQIAGYSYAEFEEMPLWGCNLYISTTEIGRIEGVFYDVDKLELEFQKFIRTLELWQLKNDHRAIKNKQ